MDDLGDALLLITLIIAGVFALPLVMAWLEPRDAAQPRHRAEPRPARQKVG